MLSLEGKEWRKWRGIFNPGFAQGHLMTLTGMIVDEAEVFCDILREHAEAKDVFRLEEVATRLTVDVIGHISL